MNSIARAVVDRPPAILPLEMEAKTVISFSAEERALVANALPSIALAFPDRDHESSEDWASWRSLRQLLQPEIVFDSERLGAAAAAVKVAGERLQERSHLSWWRQQIGESFVPPLASPPEAVLAESAQLALVSLQQLEELVADARALAGLALPV